MNSAQLDYCGREKELEFEGHTYLVRDNGSVFRKHTPGHQKSSINEIWTFGKQSHRNRYMYIGSKSVHRIVAVAFHGNPPSKRHEVDHIDRDRANNRVENLRWVTALDNLLRHPKFRNLIIRAYGSLDNFFEDPSAASSLDSRFEWLKSISKAEAARSREQLSKWAETDRFRTPGILGNRVHGNRSPHPAPYPPFSWPVHDTQSLTPLAVQRRWKTPTEFPCCPNELTDKGLAEYANKLTTDSVFSRDRYKESWVVMAQLADALLGVLVRSKENYPVKPWAVAKVKIENGKFVHEGLGMYFELNGAKKAYYGLLGIPFSGESIDDYC
jgi:hypothetical protein